MADLFKLRPSKLAILDILASAECWRTGVMATAISPGKAFMHPSPGNPSAHLSCGSKCHLGKMVFEMLAYLSILTDRELIIMKDGDN